MEWPIINSDTPISEIQRIHKMIWDYVIEHGEKPMTPYLSDCVCCQWTLIHNTGCDDCPIIWSTGTSQHPNRCNMFDNIYCKFINAVGQGQDAYARKLAKQIRDMSFRSEEELLVDDQ